MIRTRYVERGKLRVERAPYLVFINGERVAISLTQSRALFELALLGYVSNERMTGIMAGPCCNADAVRRVQICRLREKLKPHGIDIRNVPKQGYELLIDGVSYVRR